MAIFLKKAWPIISILAVLAVIFVLNHKSGTYLIGWDNLQTDLNPILNLKRAFFSAWEEYQGLGHPAGNAHLADLPRQIITVFLGILLPQNFIREFYVFLMLFVGSAGTYFLLKQAVFKNHTNAQVLSLLGGLFYMLNLSTVQTFYAPFEPYIIHFGFLPWLILVLVNYARDNSRRNLIFLIIVNILAIPQSQVPTVFFVYLLVIATIITAFYFRNRSKDALRNSLKALTVILILNSFWLLPFAYFLLGSSSVAFEAKINQMSTETVYLQNKAFGDLVSVILLKGFWFNNVDPTLQGDFAYMFAPWRAHMSNLFVQGVGFVFFVTALIGLFVSFRSKNPLKLALSILFILGFTMLATDTLPFSLIDGLVRKIGILNQALRFPYIKFSIVYSLVFACLFVLGVARLSEFVPKVVRKPRLAPFILPSICALLLAIFLFPAFQGNFLYSKGQIAIPQEYFQTFEFFHSQDRNTRIANFPQYTFWGWNYYKWGYGGSGFLWYGIKQPIMDRAFDVWSRSNENYYWELSNALYSKNPKSFNSVLNKYQINWLIVDKNIFDPNSSSDAFVPQLLELVAKIPQVKKEASFGSIDIYKVDLSDNPKSFIFTTGPLNQANGYVWGNDDRAYTDIGNYVTEPLANYFYPFRSLLSGKNQEDHEFTATDEKEFITLSNKIPSFENVVVNIPSFFQNEEIVGVNIETSQTANGDLLINLTLKTPQIEVVGRKGSNIIHSGDIKEHLLTIPQGYQNSLSIDLNGIKSFRVNPTEGPKNIGSGFLSLKEDNAIVISDETGQILESKIIRKDSFNSLLDSNNSIMIPPVEKGSRIDIKIPKISDSYASFEAIPSSDLLNKASECDRFNQGQFATSMVSHNRKEMLAIESQDSTSCLSFLIPTLSHNQGYALFIDSVNKSGRSLHTWVLNEDQEFSPIDTYLKKGEGTSSFIIPPQEQFGKSYSLHVDNISITSDKTINYLGKISLYPIPYSFLTGVKFYSPDFIPGQIDQVNKDFSVSHPNETYYSIKGLSPGSTVVLSQSFDKGWKAYGVDEDAGVLAKTLPFIFASEIDKHLLINNWENGWEAPNSQSIVVVYLPVYFEYLGFLTAFVLVLVVIFQKKHI